MLLPIHLAVSNQIEWFNNSHLFCTSKNMFDMRSQLHTLLYHLSFFIMGWMRRKILTFASTRIFYAFRLFFFFCLFIDLHVFKIAEYVWFFDIFVMYLSSQKMHYTWCHYWSFIYVRLKWKMHIYRKWNVIAKRNSTTMP